MINENSGEDPFDIHTFSIFTFSFVLNVPPLEEINES